MNVAVPRDDPAQPPGARTGIDKRPVTHPVEVRAPGPREAGLGGGLVGDAVLDQREHGGDDQAVYAYAREELDAWAAELGRPLTDGVFGENLTTLGVDVDGALIGEVWQVGDEVRLEVSRPRIPCATFEHWMGEPKWIRRFTEHGRPGAYLRVLAPGRVRAGDRITVLSRPEHGVSVAMTFRALTLEPDLLPRLLKAPQLAVELADRARRRLARRAGVTGSTV